MELHFAVIARLHTASFSTMVTGISIIHLVQATHRPITVPSLQDFIAKNSALTVISQLARMRLLYMYQSPTNTERRKCFKSFANNTASQNSSTS